MSGEFTEERIIGTDVASWFVFHPDDLAHRSADPIDWWGYEFAIHKEFAAGNLIAVNTGGDGCFKIRLTNQALTERELAYMVKSQTFRLQVRHHRLLVDGGDFLPSEYGEQPEDISSEWIEVANGNYQVTVYALAWYREPGAVDEEEELATENSLPAYVTKFQAVKDLEAIDYPASVPLLDPDRLEITFRPERLSWATSLEREYAILIRSEVIFPGVSQEFFITEDEYKYINKTQKYGSGFALIITNKPQMQTIGTLFQLISYGYESSAYKASMNGWSSQLVKLINVYERNNILWAQVEQFEPEPTSADPALVDKLKHWFAEYAATDVSYQERIPYHRFYAERVDSLTAAVAIGYAIAYVLDLPIEIKRDLLAATEAEFIQRLNEIVLDK